MAKDILTSKFPVKQCNNGTILIKVPCQRCGVPTWFEYNRGGGYIHERCRSKDEAYKMYTYHRCQKCNRIFFAVSRRVRTCIPCCYCRRRPKRRKTAITIDRLLDGEAFYCYEFPRTAFLKEGNKILYLVGDKNYDLEVVCNSYYLYKYLPKKNINI